MKVAQLCPTLWDSVDYTPWNSLGQNTEMGSLSLLHGIFPTEGLNPGPPHCKRIIYQLSPRGSPRGLECRVWCQCCLPFCGGAVGLPAAVLGSTQEGRGSLMGLHRRSREPESSGQEEGPGVRPGLLVSDQRRRRAGRPWEAGASQQRQISDAAHAG